MAYPLFQQILFCLCSQYWFISSHLSGPILPLFSVPTKPWHRGHRSQRGKEGRLKGGAHWDENDKRRFFHKMSISRTWDFQLVCERSMSLSAACKCAEDISHLALASLAWMADVPHQKTCNHKPRTHTSQPFLFLSLLSFFFITNLKITKKNYIKQLGTLEKYDLIFLMCCEIKYAEGEWGTTRKMRGNKDSLESL